jgi:hypothetical protein
MDETTALRQIAPFHAEILTAVYRAIVEECRTRGIVPVFVFLPQVYKGPWQEETPQTLRIAEAAGFTIVDLTDIYDNVDAASVRLAEWDAHPNARAHAMIADRLFQELEKRFDLLFRAKTSGSEPASTSTR